nr:MAG TPA: Regulatory protein [Caudoviricetes sp.]
MFCISEFNAMLARFDKTREDVAAMLGINPATLYRKINGQSDFTRQEIQIIRYAFNLDADSLDRIFFAA